MTAAPCMSLYGQVRTFADDWYRVVRWKRRTAASSRGVPLSRGGTRLSDQTMISGTRATR